MEEQTAGAQSSVAKNNFAVMALKELSKVDKGLAKLSETYKNVVFDVATTKGMDQAKKARMTIREVRYNVERIRKEEASRIKAAQTALNSEAERITLAVRAIEDPIDAQITAEEERKQREKEEAERKEQERTALIRAEIDRLAGTPARAEADGLSVDEINNIIVACGSGSLDGDFYKEFLAEAEHTRAKVISELHTLKAKIQLLEEEAARVAAQQAENERLRQQLAEMQAMVAKLTASQSAAVHAAVDQAATTGVGAVKVYSSGDAPVVTGVVESLHKGEPINPATESWSAEESFNDDVPFDALPVGSQPPVDLGSTHEDRLFDDEIPDVARVVYAVATHFGVDDETAKTYIVKTGEALSFGGI